MKPQNLNRTFWKAIFVHGSLSVALYLILYFIGEIKVLPNSENIISWDAVNYYTFQHQGYFNYKAEFSNVSFFPLLGLIWRWFNLSPFAALFLNVSFFLSGFYLLHRQYRFSFEILLLYLSIPSIFFFFVPYAEALFFLSTAMVVLGLERKKHLWVMMGLFIGSMTRPSAMFFFPAIIFMEIVSQESWKWKMIKPTLGRILLYFSAILLGLFIVFWIYYEATGDWFAFFYQREDNSFHFPRFPLTTWRGAKMLWLDGLAFTVAFGAVLFSLILFLKRTVSLKSNLEYPPKVILFSLAFLSMTVVHILFFNDHKFSTNPTSLFGLNRFVFATSFFLLVLFYFKNRFNFSMKINRRVYGGFIILVFAMLGVFHPQNYPEHFRPIVYLLFIFSFVFLQRKFMNFWIIVYGVHLVIQVLLLDKFLQGIWVG